jgi:hypothetical protein
LLVEIEDDDEHIDEIEVMPLLYDELHIDQVWLLQTFDHDEVNDIVVLEVHDDEQSSLPHLELLLLIEA